MENLTGFKPITNYRQKDLTCTLCGKRKSVKYSVCGKPYCNVCVFKVAKERTVLEKLKRENSTRPSILSNGSIRAHKTNTNELFVEDTKTHVAIRISQSEHGGLIITSYGNEFRPTSVNGLSAIHIVKRS